jgi:aminopeptidase N
MAIHDPHSYADDAQPRVTSFELDADVDFQARVLHCAVVLALEDGRGGRVDLDTRGLTIRAVTTADKRPLDFTVHPDEPVRGAKLSVEVPVGCAAVRIVYSTSPEATALQWLAAPQTLGGQQPFLFSQCQAIHARSVVPLQDSPRHRVTFRARWRIPRALTVVMAAAHRGREEHGVEAVEDFAMLEPIPPYLFAFAVGELASVDVSPRTRVWAEPGLVEAAAREFSGVEDMMAAAESLFGPYDWERFDVLTMPPSFPYGGMENPRLTFVTPTLVVGDRSLVDVVAHELAHSWTGNLVTNANAEHFWLNEGFTVYAERRIIEALHGVDAMVLSSALGRRALDEAVHEFADRPELTHLKTHLAGVDPDEAFSVVPYEKGYLFLVRLEQEVGRPRFDAMLKAYLRTHRFQAVTTDDFVEAVEGAFPGLLSRVSAATWLDGPGVPLDAPVFRSRRLEVVEALGSAAPEAAVAASWAPVEWVLWLDRLPRSLGLDALAGLDARFGFTAAPNSEIAVAWLKLAVANGYRPAFGRLEALLGTVGRMKYLRPLYAALLARDDSRSLAEDYFRRFRARYHPIAQQVVAGLLSRC